MPPDDGSGGAPDGSGVRHGPPGGRFCKCGRIRYPGRKGLFDHALDQHPVEPLQTGGVDGGGQIGGDTGERSEQAIIVSRCTLRGPLADPVGNRAGLIPRKAGFGIVPNWFEERPPFGNLGRV